MPNYGPRRPDEALFRLVRTLAAQVTTARDDPRRTVYRAVAEYRCSRDFGGKTSARGALVTFTFEIEPERINELIMPPVATADELARFERQWFGEPTVQYDLAINDEVAVHGEASGRCYIANRRFLSNGRQEYLVTNLPRAPFERWCSLHELALVRAWRDVPADERARL